MLAPFGTPGPPTPIWPFPRAERLRTLCLGAPATRPALLPVSLTQRTHLVCGPPARCHGPGGVRSPFWEGTRRSGVAQPAKTAASGVRRAWAYHHKAGKAAAAEGVCCSGLSSDKRKRQHKGSVAAKTCSANPTSHCPIRWVLIPGSSTI